MPENPMDAFFKAGQQVLDEVDAQEGAQAADAGGAGGDKGADAGADGDKGQRSGSPPDTDAEAGKKESVPAADADTKVVDGGEKDTDDGQEPEFIEKDGKKYYRSFDKHPEWSKLRQSEETLNQILENNDYDSIDDLVTDLKSGRSLADLIGTTDAEAVQGILKDAKDMQVTREYWAEQEAKKQEEGETQDETIDRLKREKQELISAQTQDKTRKEELQRHERAVTNFNTEIERGVDRIEGMDDTSKGMLKMFLGVGNPVEEADIFDQGAIRGAMKEAVDKFQGFVKSIQDAAIQGYVDGKKDNPQIPADIDAEPVKVVEKKKELPENATMEDRFNAASEELIEVLTSATKPTPVD